MKVQKDSEHGVTEIYPYTDKPRGFEARITVVTNPNSEYLGKVLYQGEYWTKDKFDMLATAFKEAFALSDAASSVSPHTSAAQ
jgi:hypothetical protein